MSRRLPDILPIDWPETAAEPPPRTDEALDRAGKLIRSGGLVAIPTETVYGLATDALDSESVDRIFRAKGRPAANPLIVHVADVAMAKTLAAEWPPAAAAITARFWPGPVTVVVPKHRTVPDIVTAGGPTVALRCPAHRLTRRLIERSGCPLAAPSANRSESLSPTRATHVLESLGDRIDLILDGGPCAHGIESTVVDCTTIPPRILRPGPVSREQIETLLGQSVDDHHAATAAGEGGRSAEPSRSPGTMARHYAPRTPCELTADAAPRVAELLGRGERIGWLTLRPDDPGVRNVAASSDVVVVPMPDDPAAFAAALYATLHALDQRGLDRIVCDAIPAGERWDAVRDRLTRASSPGG
jgi:L-threonylcarbamoyladenylate synthase